MLALDEIKEIEDMNLLIIGETGVGKTPIAQYANRVMTNGTDRPFVRINCAGISKERMQDEMFGHKKGAYTGAECDKKGLVEIADGGDLFLDEIGDLPLDCQADLLMFLDSDEYRRVGETTLRCAKNRIIAATNKDLDNEVNEGRFRKDLYSRLSQYRVSIPPLRERKEDILPIMEYYINKYAGFNKPYSDEVKKAYLENDFCEGNVRELKDSVK
ncbi:MAG: sigma 54-interacting transcriptional regulator [Pseudomonadota bacterium]